MSCGAILIFKDFVRLLNVKILIFCHPSFLNTAYRMDFLIWKTYSNSHLAWPLSLNWGKRGRGNNQEGEIFLRLLLICLSLSLLICCFFSFSDNYGMLIFTDDKLWMFFFQGSMVVLLNVLLHYFTFKG